MTGRTETTAEDLIMMLWGDVTFKMAALEAIFRGCVWSHCSGEAFVGIIILESMCWMRGTGEEISTSVSVSSQFKALILIRLNMFLVQTKGSSICPHLCSTPLHPSPPAARRHSSCLLWTEGLCRLQSTNQTRCSTLLLTKWKHCTVGWDIKLQMFLITSKNRVGRVGEPYITQQRVKSCLCPWMSLDPIFKSSINYWWINLIPNCSMLIK